MFSGKIHGQSQELLLYHLCKFYEEGYFCLLRCRSIETSFSVIVQQPHLSYFILNEINQPTYNDFLRYRAMKATLLASIIGSQISDVSGIFKTVNRLLQIRKTSELIDNAIQIGLSECMQALGGIILYAVKDQITNNPLNQNISVEKLVKAALKLLQCNVTTLGSSDIICSKVLYSFGSYIKSLHHAQRVKYRLQQSDLMNSCALDFDLYIRCNGNNMPHFEFIKKHVVHLHNLAQFSCLDELKLEASVAQANGRCGQVPPFVMLDFLIVLNYHALNDVIRRDDVIKEMDALILHDDGRHIY